MEPLRVSIFGAAGYLGGELVRLLLGHPHARLTHAISRSHANRPLSDVHRQLLSISDLAFSEADPATAFAESDVVFLALAAGEAQDLLKSNFGDSPGALATQGPRLIDLSGDFRIKDHSVYARAYGRDQAAPDWQPHFQYGITELERDALKAARFVANPGCFATASLLATGPLARAGWLTGPLVVNGVTGSSGSGALPRETTHHPTRATNFRAYLPLSHQHDPEVRQELVRLGAPDDGLDLAFITHSAPMVRGIHVTATAWLPEPRSTEELLALLSDTYAGSPCIRIRPEPPHVAPMAGTNFCDLSAVASGRRAVVMSTIDNLVKGGAGQAVQNMNVIHGLPESCGLEFSGLHP